MTMARARTGRPHGAIVAAVAVLAGGCAPAMPATSAAAAEPGATATGCRTEATEVDRRRPTPFETPPRMLNADRILLTLVPAEDWDDAPGAPESSGSSVVLDVLVNTRGEVAIAALKRGSGDAALDGELQRAVCAARFQPASAYARLRFDERQPVPAWVEVHFEWDGDGTLHLRQVP